MVVLDMRLVREANCCEEIHKLLQQLLPEDHVEPLPNSEDIEQLKIIKKVNFKLVYANLISSNYKILIFYGQFKFDIIEQETDLPKLADVLTNGFKADRPPTLLPLPPLVGVTDFEIGVVGFSSIFLAEGVLALDEVPLLGLQGSMTESVYLTANTTYKL